MPEGLDEQGQLAWLIGRMCIEDVRLEMAWRGAYSALCGPGLGVLLVPRDLSRIIEDCRVMLSKADLPGGVDDEVKDLASASEWAHEQRNRLVHDHWRLGEAGWIGHRWRRGRLGGVPEISGRATEEFLTDLRTMRRTWIRAWALPELIHDLVFRGALSEGDRDVDDYRAMIRGEFDVLPDGRSRPWVLRGRK